MKKWYQELQKHRAGVLLWVLSVASLIGMFVFSGEKVVPFLRDTPVELMLLAMGVPNAIAFNLCIGFLTSVFFWWLVVYTPEQKRRKLLRESLARRYRDFKHNTIQICVWAAGLSLTTQEVDALTDKATFKALFAGQRWYDVANGLEENKQHVDGLRVEMEMLAQDVTYTLNNVVIQDDDVHGLFKRLAEQIFRMRYDSMYTDDAVKYLCQFLWSIHANWSFVSGNMPNDPIDERIKAL